MAMSLKKGRDRWVLTVGGALLAQGSARERPFLLSHGNRRVNTKLQYQIMGFMGAYLAYSCCTKSIMRSFLLCSKINMLVFKIVLHKCRLSEICTGQDQVIKIN